MFDIQHLIESGGILIISLIVFAESGLLIGFFLPGDSLLFAAGLAASSGGINIWLLVPMVILAAIIGDNVGYSIGRRAGTRLFTKKESLLFRHEHLIKAEKFYEKHGGKTIIIARFTPVVRTFAPMVAGASKMTRKRFMTFNISGAVLWGGGIPLLGYFMGNRIPGLNHYIEVVVIGVLFISIALGLYHALSDKNIRRALSDRIKRAVLLNRRLK